MAKSKRKPTNSPEPIPALKAWHGPYLTTALFAEKVLKETDGVISIMRVVDWASLKAESIKNLAKNELVVLNLTMVIGFRGDDFAGDSVLKVFQTNPSGELQQVGFINVKFDPSVPNVQVITPAFVKWDKEGQYWFDIFLGDSFCSRIALHLKVRPV